VEGDAASDKIALRLAAGEPSMLELDLGDDDGANGAFPPGNFTNILVHGGAGNDSLRIDDTEGVFTDTEDTVIFGDEGTTA